MVKHGRIFVELMIGFSCLAAVIFGYAPDPAYTGEFLSGIFVGGLFLYSANRRLTVRLNLSAAFWLIHLVNPLVALLY